MGERCLGNLECITGVCSERLCSECGNLVSCPPGSRCEFRDDFHLRSHQCSPGMSVKESGLPCLFHDDCASGICDGEGELKVCFWDGETCDRDEDCAPFIPEEMEPKNTCVLVGIAGGECR